jgi:hypothetical protein
MAYLGFTAYIGTICGFRLLWGGLTYPLKISESGPQYFKYSDSVLLIAHIL